MAEDQNTESTEQIKTFTQDDLNRIATKESDRGKRAAIKELSEELGMSIDDVKALVKQQAERDEAAKSDLDKAREEAATLKRLGEENAKAAKREGLASKIQLELVRAGVPIDGTSHIVKLIDVDVDATPEDIQAKIEQVKTDLPALFATSTQKPSSSVPSGTPSTPVVGESALDKAAEFAQEFNKARGVTYPSA